VNSKNHTLAGTSSQEHHPEASCNGWPILANCVPCFLTFKSCKQLYCPCCAHKELSWPDLLSLHLSFIRILKISTAKLRILISKLCLNNGWSTVNSLAFTKQLWRRQLWYLLLQEQNGAFIQPGCPGVIVQVCETVAHY